MKYIVTIVACITLLALLFGAPVLSSSGLTWDGSTTQARIASANSLEAQRIASAERLEMERLALRNVEGERSAEFWRLFWLLFAGVGVVGILVGGAVVAHRRRTDNQTAVMLAALPILAARPGGYLAQVDGEWVVVDDAREELVPVARRLTG